MAIFFESRVDAGSRLADWLGDRLAGEFETKCLIVLGIPRGGVVVAFPVAQKLQAPLDIFLARKLGVPGHEELAFGAIAAGGKRFLDDAVIRSAGISERQIERIASEAEATLNRRAALYRSGRPPVAVEGRMVILVDDGIATGASIFSAILALREMKPAKLVVAVPVAPAPTCTWLRDEVDELVALHSPEDFYAVGQFYRDFSQVSDAEVASLLRRSETVENPDVGTAVRDS